MTPQNMNKVEKWRLGQFISYFQEKNIQIILLLLFLLRTKHVIMASNMTRTMNSVRIPPAMATMMVLSYPESLGVTVKIKDEALMFNKKWSELGYCNKMWSGFPTGFLIPSR